MKIKITTALATLMMITGISMTATSCATDNHSDIIETQWEVIPITIRENQWSWNKVAEQWEATASLPELDKFIYDSGAVLAYVFLGTAGKDEKQVQLPYVNTYFAGLDEEGYDIIFTETISYEYKIDNGKSITFIIKSSDLFQDEDAPNNYNFRVVLIW